MDALQLAVWLTVCALIIMLIRQQRPEFAVLASMAAGILSFFMLRDELSAIIRYLQQAGSAIESTGESVGVMLKAGGIALVSEFASDLCSDAGERSLAGRIDLAERIVLTSMCIPFAVRMLDQLQELLA